MEGQDYWMLNGDRNGSLLFIIGASSDEIVNICDGDSCDGLLKVFVFIPPQVVDIRQ